MNLALAGLSYGITVVALVLLAVRTKKLIVIYKKGDPDATPMIIDRLSPYYEPLHYVLMFTDGVLGWSPALLSADPVCFLLSWKHHCTGIFIADF